MGRITSPGRVSGLCPKCDHNGPHRVRQVPATDWKGWAFVVTCSRCGCESERSYHESGSWDAPYEIDCSCGCIYLCYTDAPEGGTSNIVDDTPENRAMFARRLRAFAARIEKPLVPEGE